jgi:hypothetical protein
MFSSFLYRFTQKDLNFYISIYKMSNYLCTRSYHSFYGQPVEHFSDIDLLAFENTPKEQIIYPSVQELIKAQPQLTTKKNAIIYLVNWGFGFGSALTVFMQNAQYLKSVNPDIHCLPHFSENSNHFKYHDESKHNSFFLYFRYHTILDLNQHEVFMARSTLLNDFPFFTSAFNMITIPDSVENRYTSWFHSMFQLKIGDEVKSMMKKLRKNKPTILGIHVRSLAQKMTHNDGYLHIPMEQRLQQVKKAMDSYQNYHIVIATDVSTNIDLCRSIFGNITYLPDVHRITTQDDSIPLLSQFTGFALGKDILDECLLLSLCDHIYVSYSNIPFIIKSLCPSVSMEEY